MNNVMDHFRRRRSIVTIIVFIFGFGLGVDGEGLSFDFYEKSCPQLESVVAASFRTMFLADPTTPAALLRLMFHDCQVQGCDASILLDHSEMESGKNFGIRKRETIDVVKSIVEAECPRQVSCADILVLAAREAVAASGGPRISVPLGRRDCTVAPSSGLADALLPPANVKVDAMLRGFASLGMTTQEAVAILGSHTIGVTHCLNIMPRLYKAQGDQIKGMEPSFVAFLRLTCPSNSNSNSVIDIGNSSFVLNDLTTLTFDNHYYTNAKQGRGVLDIDSEIVSDPRTAPIVQHFSTDQGEFFRVFSSAFVKLSLTGVLTSDQGVIRRKCNTL